MDKIRTCLFTHNDFREELDCVYIHRLLKYTKVVGDTLVCESPVSYERLMALYKPLTAEVLRDRIALSIELDDPLQLSADLNRMFAVVATDDELQQILALSGLPSIKATIGNRPQALLAKSCHSRLDENTRMQMLHYLAQPRPPRKTGTLDANFIRGMRMHAAAAARITPLEITMPDDLFDVAEFVPPHKCAVLHRAVAGMCARLLDFTPTDHLFVYNFSEVLRKHVLAADDGDVGTATLAVSPLYDQLGAGTLFTKYRPTHVRGFAHYKSTKQPSVVIVLNQVNYDVPKIMYNGTRVLAAAEFLADDLQLLLDIVGAK